MNHGLSAQGGIELRMESPHSVSFCVLSDIL